MDQVRPQNPTIRYSTLPLPIDPAGITGLSARILVSHYENNYCGAVRRLNAVTADLARLDWAVTPAYLANGLKREELVAANSMALHELYFGSLGQGGEPTGPLADQLARDFGSVARWRAEFAAIGKALGGGSGWVLLSWWPRERRLVNQWAADHTANLADGRPILALDMYEHAYHLDFGARAAAYVDAFMQVIDWDNVGRRFQACSQEDRAMARPRTIAFICQHASAKSLIAATYLNRLADRRGLGLAATTSGPEPDDAVPPNVVEGMASRGFDVGGIRPVLVSAGDLAQADHIVSFGADVQALARPGATIESWADCPAVSDDFDLAWTFITRRVDSLVARLAG